MAKLKYTHVRTAVSNTRYGRTRHDTMRDSRVTVSLLLRSCWNALKQKKEQYQKPEEENLSNACRKTNARLNA